MNTAIEQLNLIGKQRVAIPVEYQEQTVRKCKSRSQALRKCVEISDLEPKEIYGRLGIDQGQWSRIWAGTAFLNPDLKFALMELCGNHVPLRYDAFVCDFELTPIRTGLEQRVVDLETENAELKRALELVANAFRSK
jgi:hypothetical protein